MDAKIISVHFMAVMAGIIADLVIGDPYFIPHPVRAIGRLIGWLDKKLLGEKNKENEDPKKEYFRGTVMCVTVLAVTYTVTALVLYAAYRLNIYVGALAEAILTCYILAARSLADESMKVCHALKDEGIDKARKTVSMIVGRDTASLDEAGVIRAAVETVAENTSDGVIAPLLYTFIGGPVLGMTYKAINTMDSMVGYRNERYEYFGKCAAKLDDVFNFIPARISALCMIIGSAMGGMGFLTKNALKIFKRDRYAHKSPNSAQTESVCAGALGLRLGGDSYYFGKLVHKPHIGDEIKKEEADDIKRACVLMFLTEGVCVLLLLCITALIWTYTER